MTVYRRTDIRLLKYMPTAPRLAQSQRNARYRSFKIQLS